MNVLVKEKKRKEERKSQQESHTSFFSLLPPPPVSLLPSFSLSLSRLPPISPTRVLGKYLSLCWVPDQPCLRVHVSVCLSVCLSLSVPACLCLCVHHFICLCVSISILFFSVSVYAFQSLPPFMCWFVFIFMFSGVFSSFFQYIVTDLPLCFVALPHFPLNFVLMLSYIYYLLFINVIFMHLNTY